MSCRKGRGGSLHNDVSYWQTAKGPGRRTRDMEEPPREPAGAIRAAVCVYRAWIAAAICVANRVNRRGRGRMVYPEEQAADQRVLCTQHDYDDWRAREEQETARATLYKRL